MIKYNYEISVNDNKARLNKDIFLFRGNRNIHYYFSIKGARFTFSKTNEDLIESSNAIYAAVTVIKPNGVEVANAIAPVEDGVIHLKVTEDLIDEEVEVGDFDLVFDLFDDNEGAVTIPKIKGQFHVQERPCTTSIGTLSGNVNVVNQAVVDLAIATQENEQLIVVDDDGKYVKTTWVKGDKISIERLNKIEEGIEKNSTQYKDILNNVKSQAGNDYSIVTFPGYIFEKITKWNALGDSITEGMSTDKIYHEYISDTYSNLTVRNYGISSTEICKGGTFPNPMCERYANMNDDADLITVFGGVNDYGHNAPLGSFDIRNDATFYGGLRTLIEGLLNKYPCKMIYFFTPIKYRGCNNKNTQGKTLEDYVNVVKEICNYYSVPCVDLYNSNSLNPDIDFINTKYFADGLHPNKDGHLVLARTLTYISDTATDVKVKDITVATGTPIGENIYKQTEYLQNGNSGFWHSDGYFVEATQYHSAKINIEPGGTYQVLYDNSAFNHVLYITFIKGNTFVKQMEKILNQTTYRFPNDIDYDAVCICNLDGMDLSKVSIRAISGTGTTPGADSGDTYYSVAYALNNCSSSNSSTSILKGNSYTAIITANSNYTMKSITVTMGGIDITSTAVSGNRISINNITGDIKITATAESSGSDVVSTITPLSATLTPTGNNIYDGSTFKKDGVDGFFDSNLQWNPTDTYLSTNISVTPGGKYQILYNGNTVSKNVFITLIKDSTPVKYFDMGLNSSNYQFPNNIDFNICAITCLDSLDFSKITVKVIS